MKHVISASRIAFVFALLVGLLVTESPAQEAAAQAPQRYIVVLRSGASPQDVARDHGLQPQHVYRAALRGFAAAVPPDRLAALRADPRVALLEQERIERILPQTLPSGVDRIETDKNPNADIDSVDDVRVNYDVAIIDTGIYAAHSDLNVAGGRNFSSNDPNAWGDGNGHGTHVAGTVGALDNGYGVVGVAPGARVWAIKVCKNGGICFTGDMIAGIDWVAERKQAANNAADADPGINFAVANMSISTQDDDNACASGSDAVHQAICGLVNQGVVFALAGGNDGRSKKAYPEALAVAAIADFDGKAGSQGSPTCRSDQDDTLADFSNWFSKPADHIAAPGVCINSTWKDGGYNTISGTSMAAPHAAGAVALYLHANEQAPATSKAGADAIKGAIISAALPQGTSNHSCSYNNERGSSEKLLFVNGIAFGGTGSCDVAGGGGGGGGGSNTSPTANIASATTNEDTAVAVALSGSDAETCDLTFSIVTGPANGTLSSITNNACVSGSPNTDTASVIYTPNANFNGSDSFTYKVNDGSADSNTATVSLTVNAVNDAPVAQDKSVSTPKETAVGVTLTASDVDNCELAFSIVTGPASGTLSSITNNTCVSGSPNTDSASVTYTPNTGFTGSDSFTYKANDGTATSNTATVSITVSDQATKMHVGDLDGSSTNEGSTWTAIVSITVHDANEILVANATVSGTITYNGNSTSVSCLTNSGGQCSVSKSGIPKKNGSATFAVTGVSGTLPYDATANHDPDGDSTGTSIAVNKP